MSFWFRGYIGDIRTKLQATVFQLANVHRELTVLIVYQGEINHVTCITSEGSKPSWQVTVSGKSVHRLVLLHE